MAKKNKIPKTIAGVKLPKALRRGLKDLAASQNGRRVLTEALFAAAAALPATQKPKSKRNAGAAPNAQAAAAATPRRDQAEARAATVAALEDAARSFTDSLKRRGSPETPPVATPPVTPVATPPSAATH